MSKQRRYSDLIRCGKVKCYICTSLVKCIDIEAHINDQHSDKATVCFFCGCVSIVKQASRNRYERDNQKHLVECCMRMKIKPQKKLATKRSHTNNMTRIYREGEVVSTIFTLKQPDIPCNNIVMIEQIQLEIAVQKRGYRISGNEEADVVSRNIFTPDCTKVLDFFKSDVFNVPHWISSLVDATDDRTASNKMEYHESYNIDTIWAKVYGIKELEFYHVFVHMCVFDRFREIIETHNAKCAFLRYGCMCDKHERVHAHFVMVAQKDAQIYNFLNNSVLNCEITHERRRLSKIMKDEKIKIVPSWPDHRHFHMKHIESDIHLFNTLKYISTRNNSASKGTKTTEQDTYDLLNASTNSDIQRQVKEFINGYKTNQSYIGSHFNVFRSLSDDASMWFSAVSRNGLYSYVRYTMDKRSLIDVLDKVVVKDGRNGLIEFRHIMQYLPQFAIPLRRQDFLYHNVCGNKVIPIESINTEKYINLGRNTYMYLVKNKTPCCEDLTREIFFTNNPDSSYIITGKQRHEYQVYDRWAIKNKNFTTM